MPGYRVKPTGDYLDRALDDLGEVVLAHQHEPRVVVLRGQVALDLWPSVRAGADRATLVRRLLDLHGGEPGPTGEIVDGLVERLCEAGALERLPAAEGEPVGAVPLRDSIEPPTVQVIPLTELVPEGLVLQGATLMPAGSKTQIATDTVRCNFAGGCF